MSIQDRLGVERSTYSSPQALLSFDCEEFDLPTEYGQPLTLAEQTALGAEGLDRTMKLLSACGVPATMFTTAAMALACPKRVRTLVADGHEIASHALSHSTYEPADLRTSRVILETISGTRVTGFRRPRLAWTPATQIVEAGYAYDSSIHPTWIPGRYNGLRKSRRVHWEDGLLRIPLSVTPLVRWPVFWLAFKNMPLRAAQAAVQRILSHDGYCALCFHCWETIDLDGFRIPHYIRRLDGDAMVERLGTLLTWLSKRAQIVTYRDFFATQITALPVASTW